VWYGLVAGVIAVGAQLLGVGQVYLLLGILVANLWLAARRWHARRPENLTPRERRRARLAMAHRR